MKFYVTTPIYYSNDVPHIGHAYTTIIADVLARWNRSKGADVFFLTGTDEHGQKIAQAAQKASKSPQQLTDELAEKFKQAWRALGIDFDDFIRTTEGRHAQTVALVLNKMKDRGDIYLGTYEGLYCVGCERFLTEKELSDGRCPIHGTQPELLTEKNYFFKQSKYQKQILELIESDSILIVPRERKNEIVSFLKTEELKDLAISRPNVQWAIPIPFDSTQWTYVWVDALSNYITAVGYGSDKKRFDKWWPADLHIMAKDILKFHAVIWPAILLSIGEKPPKQMLIHGYFTVNGQKMSKSLGNVIDPVFLVKQYGADAVRYHLLREMPVGSDGDFSEHNLVLRINNELANGLGNLLNRTVALTQKKSGGKIFRQKSDATLAAQWNPQRVAQALDLLEFNSALTEIFSFVAACNKYVNDKRPWEQSEKDAAITLYNLVDSLRIVAIALEPFMPSSCEKIRAQLGLSREDWSKAKVGLLDKATVVGGPVLFSKIDESVFEKQAREALKARSVSVTVDEAVSALGLKVVSGVVENVSVKKKHEGLEKRKDKTVAESLGAITGKGKDAVARKKIRSGYYDVYQKLKIKNVVNSVDNLDELVKRAGQLPQINTAVDCYNIVSLKYGLVVGCHDIDRLQGNLRFAITAGTERYVPLGSREALSVSAGEFAVLDSAQIVCRLDEKQCESTKVTERTKHLVFYVQGNKETSDELLSKAADEIGELIVQYCGGKFRLL